LSHRGGKVTGQYHLVGRSKNNKKHRYVDLVIESPGHTVAIELAATLRKKGHLHFLYKATKDPYWPDDKDLKKGLRVAHIWHDLDFQEINTIACWWDHEKNERHITGEESL
ncbi:7919_t:CDS:2, partial [Dentiscutata erythropus]